MDMGIKGRKAIVCAASKGLGRGCAMALAREGVDLVINARTKAELEATAEEIRKKTGVKVTPIAVDVTTDAGRKQVLAACPEPDIIVNNAGYSQGGAIEQVPLDAARSQFETNVFGLIGMTQLVLPAMRAQRWGKVVNIGSMGGRLTFPGGGLYHATKYAVEAISDALRFEVRGFGVDVVLIEPGLIVTEFSATAVAKAGEVAGEGPYAEFDAKVAALTTGVYEGPMRRLGGMDELAEFTAVLLDGRSRFQTGQFFSYSGGWST